MKIQDMQKKPTLALLSSAWRSLRPVATGESIGNYLATRQMVLGETDLLTWVAANASHSNMTQI